MDPIYHHATTTSDQLNKYPIICRYPKRLKRKYFTGVFLVFLLFFWGYWYIDDPGWILLGITTICLAAVYFMFRVARIIKINKIGLTKMNYFREQFWKWDDIDMILFQNEKVESSNYPSQENCRRIVMFREDNHEMVLDNSMIHFKTAYAELKIQAKQRKIKLSYEPVGWVIPFW
jgi:hypothetical protein